MASALDVAEYILQRRGPLTTMKLQKLVYYCQVWSIVWDDDVMFPERIEAWRNGPVVRELWETTRGLFRVDNIPGGNPSALTDQHRATVERVLEFYCAKDAQWLSDLTHMEAPWREAFAKEQSTEISLERISEYYSSLDPIDEQARS